ncbi:vesicle transport v-SNARE protein N-terminus-domain-containing protein [Crepidotus variabilis]|uniref:Vesicle transport v-SNARE protein N-terminus-domain-containing protein n=1 Tax=Crepidotus variabilis TaxID=179855 RepID=A0A9P6EUA1_9AGAR|nr:vesicle transport v-SNARE protein N-terminus-domain-containing protein [Crepidotus variabilis]
MDTSPTALFDSYEADFRQFIETIREKLETNELENERKQRKTTLRRVEMELDEADEMVSQMELEVASIPQSVRSSYQTRLRSAKADLQKYKKLLTESRSQLARADLLSSSDNAGAYSSDDPYSSDRTRLLAGTTLLEQGSKRLQQSQQIALETEAQGADILMNLRGQREQIENSRDTLNRADLAIDRASSTLKQMVRRMYQQRVVTGAIIGVMLLLIIVISWEKLAG